MNPTPPPLQHDARTDGKAVWSLVCGILSLTCLSFLSGIPAIVLGHMSRSAIQKSMGRLKGQGMALAGLIMGYISVAMIPIVLIIATIMIPSLLRSRQLANESASVANLRTINTAEVTYRDGGGAGKYGDLNALVGAHLLDESIQRPSAAGYRFTVVTDGNSYTATATPATPNTGRYGFYVTTDGIVRYSVDAAQAPLGQNGLPVP